MHEMINIGAGRFRLEGWGNIDHASEHYRKNEIDYDIDLLGDYSFPFEDNSIEAAYSSHVIEHLPEGAVLRIIREAFRVLKPGGYFRITCPDAREALDALKCGNNEFFHIYDSSICFNIPEGMIRYHLDQPLSQSSIYQKFLYFLAPQRCIHVNVPCEKITDEELSALLKHDPESIYDAVIGLVDEEVRAANPWMHISWWTITKLMNFLQAAGFSRVTQSFPGMSEFEGMRDLHHFDWALPKLSLYIEAVK